MRLSFTRGLVLNLNYFLADVLCHRGGGCVNLDTVFCICCSFLLQEDTCTQVRYKKSCQGCENENTKDRTNTSFSNGCKEWTFFSIFHSWSSIISEAKGAPSIKGSSHGMDTLSSTTGLPNYSKLVIRSLCGLSRFYLAGHRISFQENERPLSAENIHLVWDLLEVLKAVLVQCCGAFNHETAVQQARRQSFICKFRPCRHLFRYYLLHTHRIIYPSVSHD